MNVLSGDGWLEFKANETTSHRVVGLSSLLPVTAYAQMEYGFYLQPNNVFTVIEGTKTLYTGTYAATDVFKIVSQGGAITYYKGPLQLTLNEPSTPPTKSYRATVAMYTHLATIADLKVSFTVPLNVINVVQLSEMDYDHAGRLVKQWHTLNKEKKVLMTTNTYNELGQLTSKQLHSADATATTTGTFAQKVDYRYNIRGWLTRINNASVAAEQPGDPADLFGMELSYEQPLNGITNSSQVAYNGNISAIRWSNNLALGGTIDNPAQRAYRYTYDAMNRLEDAEHFEQATAWLPVARYREQIPAYDLNGNILSLNRTGKAGTDIDQLTYNYGTGNLQSNRLLRVDDSSQDLEGLKNGTNTNDDYVHDANGNMTTDRNKDVSSIVYNYLNLPERVNKTNGEYLKYDYDAMGRKLAQRVFNAQNIVTKRTDYAGSLVYENDVLQFANTAEGRIIVSKVKDEPSEYQYHLKDHLGNIRLTFTTKDETDAALATVEPENEEEEAAKILFLDEAVRVNSELFNHTQGTATQTAVRLSGFQNERTGLARSLSVMPGDVIKAAVYTKYIDQTAPPEPALAAYLAAVLAGGTGSPVIDGGAAGSTGVYMFPYNDYIIEEKALPPGWLNLMFFDRDDNFIAYKSVQMMAGVGAEDGTDVAHQKLELEYTVNQPGYVFVYLSNDSEAGLEQDVFFDDFEVNLVKGPVVQQSDYYAFGLETENSYTRENAVKQDFKYNGKEMQDELGIGWLDYGARMYMPELGRWGVVDPSAPRFFDFSPYHYAYNRPNSVVDPDGRENIVISGGETDKDKRYKYNFIESAIRQLKTYAKEGEESGEGTTWIVTTVGYSEKQLKKFEKTAQKLGVNFVRADNKEGVNNYINSKSTDNSELSEGRTNDKVTDLAVFSHGYAGTFEFGYHQGKGIEEQWSYGVSDAAGLNSGAFQNANVLLYSCNSATYTDGNPWSSLAGQISKQTGSTVVGLQGKTDYSTINNGEGYLDKVNRYSNGFNTEGSQSLPSKGNRAVDNPDPAVTWRFIPRNVKR